MFRRRLAQAEADVEVATLMGYEAASMLDSGRIPTVEVSVEKIFTSELRQRIADLAIDLLGPDGTRTAVADGFFERLYRVSPLMRFGGGTNEVLRDVIAQRGHGMPSLRAVTGMRLIPDQDERDLAAMCRERAGRRARAGRRTVEGAGRRGVLGLADRRRLGDRRSRRLLRRGRTALCPRVVHSTVFAALAVDWLGGGSRGWLPGWRPARRAEPPRCSNPRDASDVTPSLQARRDGGRLAAAAASPTSSPTPMSPT